MTTKTVRIVIEGTRWKHCSFMGQRKELREFVQSTKSETKQSWRGYGVKKRGIERSCVVFIEEKGERFERCMMSNLLQSFDYRPALSYVCMYRVVTVTNSMNDSLVKC